MSDLRKSLIRLAHVNPEMRDKLLPLLKAAARTMQQKFPKGSMFTTVFPRGSKMEPLPGPRGLIYFEVVDHDERFTPFGGEPFVTYLLLEDAKGNHEWVPPWGAGAVPKPRDDFNALAAKMNRVFKPLGLIRAKGYADWAREWKTAKYGVGPDVGINDVYRALQKLPDYIKVSKKPGYAAGLQWPLSHGYGNFDVRVDADTVTLQRKR